MTATIKTSEPTTCTCCQAVIFRHGVYWTAPSQPWPINCCDTPGLMHVPANV